MHEDVEGEVKIEPILTKAEIWSYEDEYRMLSLNKEGVVSFGASAIEAVYLGLSCSEENERQIANKLEAVDYKFDLYKMTKTQDRFGLREEKLFSKKENN